MKNGEILVQRHRHLLDHPDRRGAFMEMTVIVLLVVIILLAAYMLFREFQHVNGQMQKLEKRVDTLENANRLRMPHQAQDNILDVIAMVSDVLETEQDLNLLEQQRREREEKKLQDALGRLKQALAIGTKREEK